MEKFKIKKTALLVNVSIHTLKNWYYWSISEYNKTDLKFPTPGRDEQGRMLFTYDDVDKIIKFKNSLKYGDMTEFNRRYK